MGEGATPRIALIAGELSGDVLAAGLMARLRVQYPSVTFEGVGGPRMAAEGLVSRVPMERLSLMGLTEIVCHLPWLLWTRRKLVRDWQANPPDIFIGVDLPDFNLGVEKRLRQAGILTVHYVSPTVWAWRQGRIRTIRKAVDRMLTLFPFEQDFYARSGVDAVCVGHPAADQYPIEPDQAGARAALGTDPEATVIALLPGSRRSEVDRLAPAFAGAAARLRADGRDVHCLVPVAQPGLHAPIEEALQAAGVTGCTQLVAGRTREVLTASDVVLTASGTATLEAMLAKRPMVSAYRLAPLTFRIVRWLVRVPWSSKPNLLAQEALVPEFFQDDVNADTLADALAALLDDAPRRAALIDRFTQLHRLLARDADQQAADAVARLLTARGDSSTPEAGHASGRG